MSERKDRTQAQFPSTQWSLLAGMRAHRNDEAARIRSFAKICELYWYPLYAFARHRGKTSHDAEDAVQAFFALAGTAEYFEKADQERGRLRTFLLTGFTRFLKDLHVHHHAIKRGGDAVTVSIDVDDAESWLQAAEVSAGGDGVMEFEREWARTIMRHALAELEKDAGATEKSSTRFAILKRFLTPDSCANYSRDDAARDLGMSADACDKAIQRLRSEFRQVVRARIVATLAEPDEDTIRTELEQLQRALLGAA